MGLDQFLEARRYVSGYSHEPAEKKELFHTIVDAIGLADVHDDRYATVSVNVATWRKSYHVHDWFVAEVQGGKDDCGSYQVERETLYQLLDLCTRVAASGDPAYAAEQLPIRGLTVPSDETYDEYYFEDVEWTAERLAQVLDKVPDTKGFESYDFYYSSSW